MARPQILVKDVLECFKSEVASAKTLDNLKKCLVSFKFSDDDDIVPLYFMILDDPTRFKDHSNFPKAWKSDSSRKLGVSAINRSLNTSIVQSNLEQVDILRVALGKFMAELSVNNVADDDVSSIGDDAEKTKIYSGDDTTKLMNENKMLQK